MTLDDFLKFLIYCRKIYAWKKKSKTLWSSKLLWYISKSDTNHTKLSSNLWSMWITKASKFKQNRDVSFLRFFVISSVKMQLPWIIQAFYIKDQNPQNQILHHTEKMNVNNPSPRKERKRILRDNNLCNICYESTTHAYKTCNADMKWLERDSERHRTAMPLRMVTNQQVAHGTHCSTEQE